MVTMERGTIVGTRDGWQGVQRLWVEVPPRAERISAINYLDINGPLSSGDRVLLNTNALRLGLGTGGDAFVVARLNDGGEHTATLDEPDGSTRQASGARTWGHMVKMRYTPVQMIVNAVDDPLSPHHDAIHALEDLQGMPVLVADLHSALPAIVAGIRLKHRDATIAYIYTDTAALAVAYSRTVQALRQRRMIQVISAGQAFGGDFEAVSIASALAAAASVVSADITIVCQGPGNLGTGTRWGFSGIAVADALHQAAAMGARPLHALRVSSADPRERHRGLSHHSSIVLERMLHIGVDLPLAPQVSDVDAQVHDSIRRINEARGDAGAPQHEVRVLDVPALPAALDSFPVPLSTMGRTYSQDRAAFEYPAIAGYAAATLV